LFMPPLLGVLRRLPGAVGFLLLTMGLLRVLRPPLLLSVLRGLLLVGGLSLLLRMLPRGLGLIVLARLLLCMLLLGVLRLGMLRLFVLLAGLTFSVLCRLLLFLMLWLGMLLRGLGLLVLGLLLGMVPLILVLLLLCKERGGDVKGQ